MGQQQSKSRAVAGAGEEQGRNRAGAELSLVEQSWIERGQELARSWAGGKQELGRN